MQDADDTWKRVIGFITIVVVITAVAVLVARARSTAAKRAAARKTVVVIATTPPHSTPACYFDRSQERYFCEPESPPEPQIREPDATDLAGD